MKTSRHRFSLIEFFCVVVVLLVLFSMMYPAFLKTRQKSKMVLCGNNLHQTFMGAMSSAQNNRGNFAWVSPNKGFGSNGWIAAAEGNDAIWADADGYMGQGLLYNEGYLTDGRLLYCPMAKGGITFASTSWGGFGNMGKPGYSCSSYAWNGIVGYTAGSWWGRNAKVSDSGRTPLSVDSMCQKLHSDGFMVLRLDGSCNWSKTDPSTILPFVPNFGWDQMYNYGWNGAFK